MRFRLIALAAVVAIAPLSAQDASVRPEIRPFVGALIPTGDHRSDFRTATTLGMQGALELSKYMHVVGTVAWTHGHTKFSAFSDDVTHVWHYDAGAEFNAYYDAGGMLFRPFLGFGIGARTYDYKQVNQDSRTCSAGYAAIGSEFQVGSFGLRTEARDYLNCFRSPIDGRRSPRNDVMLTVGLAYHLW